LTEEGVKNLTAEKSMLKKDVEARSTSADVLAMQAEEKSNLTLIAKSNSMHKSSRTKDLSYQLFRNYWM